MYESRMIADMCWQSWLLDKKNTKNTINDHVVTVVTLRQSWFAEKSTIVSLDNLPMKTSISHVDVPCRFFFIRWVAETLRPKALQQNVLRVLGTARATFHHGKASLRRGFRGEIGPGVNWLLGSVTVRKCFWPHSWPDGSCDLPKRKIRAYNDCMKVKLWFASLKLSIKQLSGLLSVHAHVQHATGATAEVSLEGLRLWSLFPSASLSRQRRILHISIYSWFMKGVNAMFEHQTVPCRTHPMFKLLQIPQLVLPLALLKSCLHEHDQGST